MPPWAPSRSALKLLEAFTWLDRCPEAGEVCVDLGASPGGWTSVLVNRCRARVFAVDLGKLAPPLQNSKLVTHIPVDAFKLVVEEPVDWLLSDMAFRPLEAASLLGKWARNRWANGLIANIKLPMQKRAEMLLRVLDILESGGWREVKSRQLYHDRDEITVAGASYGQHHKGKNRSYDSE
jgi:23S rRNA (cytidine2498-2'-O)-methyltransferase